MNQVRIMAATFSFCLSAACAFAADQVPASDGAGASCRTDAEKLCQGVQPGEGRIVGCLKEHREEVSDTCKARLAQMRVRRTAKPATHVPPVSGK